MQVKRAIISVSNKDGVVEFAKQLAELGVEIISSGGTAKKLMDAGIKVKKVSEVTEFPEMMNGRVKTLHPKIHGAILADRSKEDHLKEAKDLGIGLIDLVVVNLYPFEKTVEKDGVTIDEAIENIDIGGPTLVRAAAKNYKSVAVVVNPKQYGEIVEAIKAGKISTEMRQKLSLLAFEHVSHYDVAIERFLRKRFNGAKYPEYLNLSFHKIQDLRYGENSHQSAAVYDDKQVEVGCVPDSRQLQGKELSYNNILDTNSAFEIVREFEDPTVVVMKHNNPTGVATRDTIEGAYDVAFAGDSQAAFGGIVALNRPATKEIAQKVISSFMEVVIAPKFEEDSLEIFAKKKRLRLLEVKNVEFPLKRPDYVTFRSVAGGLLVQDFDNITLDSSKLEVVTKRKPTENEMQDLIYAWKVAKYVVSNSVVYARDKSTVGIGAGQMKRVDSALIAAMIAKQFNRDLKGSCMASEAFFPFRDAVDAAAKAGISAIIQPGGSIRDKEVIAACDEHEITMVFTGIRHFKH